MVCIWDASTGACLKEMRHERAGGCVVSLKFSPEGALLLSAAADPDGALRVWDVATGTEVLGARTEAPVASVGWCVHSSLPEFVIAGADGVWLHSLADETGEFCFISVWAIRMSSCFVRRHHRLAHRPAHRLR